MINGFEDFTNELNEDEKKLIPILMSGFKKYSKDNPIKAKEIVSRLNEFLSKNEYGIKMTDVRLRKLVNHIRSSGKQPIIATSNGYYVSYDKDEIRQQIESLQQRARSINVCAEGLSKFI